MTQTFAAGPEFAAVKALVGVSLACLIWGEPVCWSVCGLLFGGFDSPELCRNTLGRARIGVVLGPMWRRGGSGLGDLGATEQFVTLGVA